MSPPSSSPGVIPQPHRLSVICPIIVVVVVTVLGIIPPVTTTAALSSQLPYCYDPSVYGQNGSIREASTVFWGTANTTDPTPCLLQQQSVTFDLTAMLGVAQKNHASSVVINMTSVVMENVTLEIRQSEADSGMLRQYPLVFVLADSNITGTTTDNHDEEAVGSALTTAATPPAATSTSLPVTLYSNVLFWGALPDKSSVTFMNNSFTKTATDLTTHTNELSGTSFLALRDTALNDHSTFSIIDNDFSLQVGSEQAASKNVAIGGLVTVQESLLVSQSSTFQFREGTQKIEAYVPHLSDQYVRRFFAFGLLPTLDVATTYINITGSSSLIFGLEKFDLNANVIRSSDDYSAAEEKDTQLVLAASYLEGALIIAGSSTYVWTRTDWFFYTSHVTSSSSSSVSSSFYAEALYGGLTLRDKSSYTWERSWMTYEPDPLNVSFPSSHVLSIWKVEGGFVQDSDSKHIIKNNDVQPYLRSNNSLAVIDISNGDIDIAYPSSASSNVYNNQYTNNDVTVIQLNNMSMVRLAPNPTSSKLPLLAMEVFGDIEFAQCRLAGNMKTSKNALATTDEGAAFLLQNENARDVSQHQKPPRSSPQQQQSQQNKGFVSFLWTTSSVTLAALSFSVSDFECDGQLSTPAALTVPEIWHADVGTSVSLFQPSHSCLLVEEFSVWRFSSAERSVTRDTKVPNSVSSALSDNALPQKQLAQLVNSGKLVTGDDSCRYPTGLSKKDIIIIVVVVVVVVAVAVGVGVGIVCYRKKKQKAAAADSINNDSQIHLSAEAEDTGIDDQIHLTGENEDTGISDEDL